MYNLKLWPDQYKAGVPVVIPFTNSFDLDNYVRKEYNYCKQEELAYLAAIFPKHRERAMENLSQKRIEFAKKQGVYSNE